MNLSLLRVSPCQKVLTLRSPSARVRCTLIDVRHAVEPAGVQTVHMIFIEERC